ncbi:MAG TPA: o-succinylbenzoate--CoA ligase [Bacillota bacterium]|nr:o-succinylbenzoate--CoA ligase [Bacillota bacterium]
MSEIIPHWLSKQAQLKPKKQAIELQDGTSLTFQELEEKSKRFARKLAQTGVLEGTHIGILSGNNLDMVIAIHALSYLGAIGVLFNTRLTTEELTYQANDARVSMILSSHHFYDQAKQIQSSLTVFRFSDIEQLEEKEVSLRCEINLSEPFTIIYTSGTTGKPKGVVHTYGNHWWSAVGSALNLGVHTDDKWLNPLPLFHVGGLAVLIRSVMYGMPVFLMERFDETAVQEAIMKKDVTIASVVTVMLQRLVEVLEEGTYPDHFRCMLLGGGPAPKPLLENAKARNIPVFQSYGMTETSSQIVTLSPQDALNKIGSAGKPLFPAQLKIDAAPNEVGEIFVKGPMVTSGYFNKPAATAKAFVDGWLATGDLGYVDEAGFLYVVERRTDLIISGGENVYPSEVESVLSGMDGIREVGVVGKQDDQWGQSPVAFVVTDSPSITKEAIIAYAKKRLAKYKLPTAIYFVEQLPRNASNKLMRQTLVKWLRDKS